MSMFRRFKNLLKGYFPYFFATLFRLRDGFKTIPARVRLLSFSKGASGMTVAYLSGKFPGPPARRGQFSHGGAVKLTYLAETFPHTFPAANLLYAVSSVAHPIQMDILEKAKREGIGIVVNQNGVAFPAWNADHYENTNRYLNQLIGFADHIIYQSWFCREGAERYISPPDVPSTVIYNPVDVDLYAPPAAVKKTGTLTLLLGGNQYQKYRLNLALQTLAVLLRFEASARLIVTGSLWSEDATEKEWVRHAIKSLRLEDHVTFTGTYSQINAPKIFSQADILLHTQYADASPGLVGEAMALGIPVVHLDNGGVPELVGDAGIGVHVEYDWNKINLPDPQAMANAVMQVYSRRKEFSQRARQRAVDLLSLEKFIERHKEIFEKVLNP